MKRCSGIFLHPTSLPSPFGIGDLGSAAFEWVSLLKETQQSLWQVCPLGPTGYGDSPYQSFSSFAGNNLLISPVKLLEMGLIDKQDIAGFPALPDDHVDYGSVINEKEKLFRKAYARFDDATDFSEFCKRERYWLDNYALFRVIKDQHQGQPWYSWASPLKLRYPSALEEIAATGRRDIRYHKFLQFVFYQQWMALKSFANEQGIRVIGDIPYYVAYDSCDTWASPELFEFDEAGKALRVAGVPPDYFSADGQLWGNPLYRWDHMHHDGFAWWVSRIRKMFELFDVVRLDHFRGFESYWAIPADSPTAIKGEWVKGPGMDLFHAVQSTLGSVSIIAEDLGEITKAVENLRWNAGLPGMKVLQFAFDGGPLNPYLLHNIYHESITYTGTHDNDTSLGWFDSLDEKKRKDVCEYIGCRETEFIDGFLRLAFMSPSYMCIVPLQDVLGLDSRHRMNKPGTSEGNWQWRFTKDMIDKDRFSHIRNLARIYGRLPVEKPVAVSP